MEVKQKPPAANMQLPTGWGRIDRIYPKATLEDLLSEHGRRAFGDEGEKVAEHEGRPVWARF